MLWMARTGYIPKRCQNSLCCSQCHLNHVVQVWHVTNSRQPKQIRRQTIVCLPNTTVNNDTNASIIEFSVTHSEYLLSRWKTNCRIQERNYSIIQQGQIYFQFGGDVYISPSLTLPNTVISLIKALYEGVRAYVIIIYVYFFFVPSCLFKPYNMHSTCGYVRSATTHHHRVSSCGCPGT